MQGTYAPWLVMLSVAVAIMASYVALDLAARVTASVGLIARYWLLGGAVTMGIGIWSMHFIGMLAFRLPMAMSYDIPLTLLSLGVAIVASGFALHIAAGAALGGARLVGSSVVMGVGIAAMHYAGMAAMRMRPAIEYDPLLFILSIAIAVGASMVSIRIAFGLREDERRFAIRRKAASAVVMGAAICGMHYTGMAAANFAQHAAPTDGVRVLDSALLAATIGVFTAGLLAVTLLISILERRFKRDVAAHEQGARALQAKQEEARAIIDTALDAFVAIDSASTIVEWNRQAELTFGWSRDEAIGNRMSDLIMPATHRSAHERGLKKYIETGDGPMLGRRFETTALHRNGQEFPIELSVWPTELGETPRFHAFLRDISDRHRELQRRDAQSDALEESRRTLIEKEQRLAEAQRIAHVGSWEWDVLNDRITWSDELYRVYGIDQQQFEPSFEGYLRNVHPDDRELVEREVDTAFKSQQPFTFEHRILRPDGSIGVMKSQGRVIVDADGRTVAMLGTGQDVTEAKQKEQELLRLAHFDALTGLPNRRQFREALQKAMAAADEHDQSIPILFLDLDQFKNVNDTLGHVIGDEMLRQVGTRLLESLRTRDTVGRLGGDEFGFILMTPPDPQIAAKVADKILAAMRKPFLLEGREVAVTASIGIVVYPTDATDIDTLIKFADTAMYAAKESGRDTYRFYTAEMNTRALQRLEMETALRGALERREFVLQYQPKISLVSGQWTGTEALLRWQRPAHGCVMPADFIASLEDTGLIVPVGSWIIDAACRQMAQWKLQEVAPAGIAVNVSARQVLQGPLNREEVTAPGPQPAAIAQSRELEAAAASAMREHGIGPGLLEFELTEGTLMSQAELTVDLLGRLKSQGIRVSIDDFGTGYSSLAYLRRFPIDTVKIDRVFVHDITSNVDAAAVATAIISMAHSLKLKVVAEGIETREQLEMLRDLGCDEAQGYYIARPMPAEGLATLFRAGTGPSHLIDQAQLFQHG